MGTTSTTATANWTVVRDANGFPTEVSGDDVKIYVNASTPFFTGEAWSDVDLMDPIPSGATIIDLSVTLTVQVDGSQADPFIAINPDLQFIDKATYLSGTFLAAGTFAAGGVGALPNDNDPHALDYVNSVYRVASGGAGIADLDAFAAALSNPSTPVILRAQGPGQASTGSGITYFAPITLTFTWEGGAPTPIPPLRLTNRDTLRIGNRRDRQGSNRLTGYL